MRCFFVPPSPFFAFFSPPFSPPPRKEQNITHTHPERADPKHNLIVQEYVLPDLTTNRKGRVRHAEDIITETDQILVMNNERFTVPELLFRPDDIGV